MSSQERLVISGLRLAACLAFLLACGCRAPWAESAGPDAIGIAVYLTLDHANGQLTCLVRCEGPGAVRLHANTLASIETDVEFVPLANGKPVGEPIMPDQTPFHDPNVYSTGTPRRQATDRVLDLRHAECIGKAVPVWDVGWWKTVDEVLAKHQAVLIVPRTLIIGADDSGAPTNLGFMPGHAGSAQRGFVLDRQSVAKLKKLRDTEKAGAKPEAP